MGDGKRLYKILIWLLYFFEGNDFSMQKLATNINEELFSLRLRHGITVELLLSGHPWLWIFFLVARSVKQKCLLWSYLVSCDCALLTILVSIWT